MFLMATRVTVAAGASSFLIVGTDPTPPSAHPAFERGETGCHLGCRSGWCESWRILDTEHPGDRGLQIFTLWQPEALWKVLPSGSIYAFQTPFC